MRFPITDSHLHLWDNQNLNYPWLEKVPTLNQAFLLTELMDATKSLHIESFVFVQSDCDVTQSLAEATWVSELAKRDARIHGIVAHAPLEIGLEVKSHLAALKENKLVKGIRRLLQSEPDDFFAQAKLLQGIQLLPEFNFSFDLCVKPNQLPVAIRLVEQCPEVRFVLNHLGRPNVAEKQLQPWQDNISKLAAFPNVWCKISGLTTEAQQHAWRSDDLKPYIQHAIKEFSFERVMFGSDWPMVHIAASYTHWAHTLYDLLSHEFSEPELKKLFHENVWRFYQLAPGLIEF
jgi:L-fuconolactonase